MSLNEEKIDRRAHWAYGIVGAIVLATAQWIRLESRVNGVESSMAEQKKARDQEISMLWNKYGADHDKQIALRQCAIDHGWRLIDDK